MTQCSFCQQELVSDTPDPCLGHLDGVEGACCGHGLTMPPYVVFEDEDRLDGLEALRYFESLGVGALPPPAEYHYPLTEQYDGMIRLTSFLDYKTGNPLRVEWVNDHPTETPLWEINGQTVELAGSGSVEVVGPIETGTL
jgi:hypothetical protein